MGETGKRSRHQRDNDGSNKNQRRRTERDDNAGDELIVYRILCPDGVIGSVIGKGGKVINSIRQETRAKIKVVDPFPGATERVITVYCYVKEKEEVEVDDVCSDKEPLCPAQAALLKLYAAIAQSVSTLGDSEKKWKDKDECSILVPASQSANIIGKSGATIKKLRSMTRANIKVTPKDLSDLSHSCALEFDNFVRITGEPEAVKKALFAVSAVMYKFAPREAIPLNATVQEAPPSIIIPSDVPIYPAAGFYGGADPVLPSRSLPLISPSVSEFSGYADSGCAWPPLINASIVHGYGGTSQKEELIIRVLCPSDKIGRVIGKGGISVRNIRQASGAQIEVVDNKGKGEDSIVTVIAAESVDDLKSMAVEAVLLLQEKINDEDAETVVIRVLVPSKVIGCIIGKGGNIINEIRKKSKADVRISKGKTPKYVDSDDELVEVSGQVVNVRDALVQIVLRLRDDVLRNKDNGNNSSDVAEPVHHSISASAGSHPLPPSLSTIPSVAPLGYDQGLDNGTRLSRFYGYEQLPMSDSSHGSVPSYLANVYGRMAPPTTLEIVIPVGALGKVMGKGGANLGNIRQISGAVIEISESVTSRGDRLALISGTPDQKRSAENLIQAFIMST